MTLTKEEQYIAVLKFKTDLEVKINCEYLPLQRKMNGLLDQGNFAKYVELESKMAIVRKEVEQGYDELLKMHRELHERFSKEGS
jgi:hypothetical protein